MSELGYYQGEALRHLASPFKFLLAAGKLNRTDMELKTPGRPVWRRQRFKEGQGEIFLSDAATQEAITLKLQELGYDDLNSIVPPTGPDGVTYTDVSQRGRCGVVWLRCLPAFSETNSRLRVVIVDCGPATFKEYNALMDASVCTTLNQTLEKSLLWKHQCFREADLINGSLSKHVDTFFSPDAHIRGVLIEYMTADKVIETIQSLKEDMSFLDFEPEMIHAINSAGLPKERRGNFAHHFRYRGDNASFYAITPANDAGEFSLEYIEVNTGLVDFHNTLFSKLGAL